MCIVAKAIAATRFCILWNSVYSVQLANLFLLAAKKENAQLVSVPLGVMLRSKVELFELFHAMHLFAQLCCASCLREGSSSCNLTNDRFGIFGYST